MARGMMKDVRREEREIEDGMKEVELLILREGERNGTKGEEGLLDEEGKALGNVGREDAICVCVFWIYSQKSVVVQVSRAERL